MQAYASAELTPLAPEFRVAPVPAVAQAASVGVNSATPRVDNNASLSPILASVILDGLDDQGLAVLAQRLLPHLRQPGQLEPTRGQTAYTVASLAAELGVSQKAIRCAIARRELSAVKRGSRWIISANAVHTWATASEARRRSGRGCRTTAPTAAGPSLHCVLCAEPRRGGTR